MNRYQNIVGALVFTLTAVQANLAYAQAPQWTPSYQLRMSGERAEAFVRGFQEGLPFVPGEVIVKFRDGVDPVGQQAALNALRSRPRAGSLQWRGDVAVLRESSDMDSVAMAERLSLQPEVEYAEPNYISRRRKVPNDPGFSTLQWNLNLIDMPRAWDINPGASSEVKVAVIDSGLTTTNGSFTFPTWNGRANQLIAVPFKMNPGIAATRIDEGFDFVFWDGPVLDMDGHGSHVSSTIGESANDGIGEAGIAYNVTIMPLKVCFGFWDVQFTLSASGYRGFAPEDIGGCPLDAEAAAIRYAADHGANVINLSVGGTSRSTTLLDAIRYAVGKGVFVAISAGNSFDEGNAADYPAAYSDQIDGVMAVAAVGRSGKHAYYSTTGAYVEITAPGGDIYDGGYDGLIWQSTLYQPDSDSATVIFPRFDRYAETPEQGKSMASPHIAAIAALLYSQGVTNPAAIEALLKATARDVGAAGRDDMFGYGLAQPRAALFGFGVAK